MMMKRQRCPVAQLRRLDRTAQICRDAIPGRRPFGARRSKRLNGIGVFLNVAVACDLESVAVHLRSVNRHGFAPLSRQIHEFRATLGRIFTTSNMAATMNASSADNNVAVLFGTQRLEGYPPQPGLVWQDRQAPCFALGADTRYPKSNTERV